jgi:hypothetical protein
MDLETYFFFHGWPTDQRVGGKDCTCSEKILWGERFLQHFADGSELMASECAACQAARERRARVIPRAGDTSLEAQRLARVMEDVTKLPFVEAPAVYAYNVPKWSTLLLRAREYAKQTLTTFHFSAMTENSQKRTSARNGVAGSNVMTKTRAT